ncbi:hypothetical protein IOD13_05300 [Brevibacterium casei]|nr:hypothetical protein [Brevibacterium casei]
MANDTDPAPTTRTEEREPVEPSPDESGPDQPSPDRPNPDQPAPDTTDDAAFYSKGPRACAAPRCRRRRPISASSSPGDPRTGSMRTRGG